MTPHLNDSPDERQAKRAARRAWFSTPAEDRQDAAVQAHSETLERLNTRTAPSLR